MAEETKDPVATEAPVGGPVPTPQVDAPTAPDLNISKAFNKLSTFLDHVVSQQQKDQGEANNG